MPKEYVKAMTKIHNGKNNHSSTNLYLAAARCLVKSIVKENTCWNNDRLNLCACGCLKLSDLRKFQKKASTCFVRVDDY